MLIRGYCVWRWQKKVQKVLFLFNMLQVKRNKAIPVTHIFSSPEEPTIISSVFIDLPECYLIIISQY